MAISARSFFIRVGLSSSATPSSAGVPLGLVLAALFCTSYVVPIGCLTDSFSIGFHKYVYDTQLFAAPTVPFNSSLTQACTVELLNFWQNDRLLNSDRSEVCFFGILQQLQFVDVPSLLTIVKCCVVVCEKLKTLDVTLGSMLNFELHINSIIQSCNYHI